MFLTKNLLTLLFNGIVITALTQNIDNSGSSSSKAISPARHELDDTYLQTPAVNSSVKGIQKEQTSTIAFAFQNEFLGMRNQLLKSQGYLKPNDKQTLTAILNKWENSLGSTFEFQLFQYRLNRNQSISPTKLKQLVTTFGLRPELHAELAWQAAKNNNEPERNNHVNALVNSGQITKAQLILAQAQLQQLPAKAIIITNGEFDTYPLWLAQGKNNGIFILSLEMAEDTEWLNEQLKNRGLKPLDINELANPSSFVKKMLNQSTSNFPVFISLSVRKNILNEISNTLEFAYGIAAKKGMLKAPNSYVTKYGDALLKELKKVHNDPNKKILSNLLPGFIAHAPDKKDSNYVLWEKIITELEHLTGNQVAR